MVTGEAFRQANRRGRLVRDAGPTAVAARYDPAAGRVEVELSNGLTVAFPPALAQGVDREGPRGRHEGQRRHLADRRRPAASA